MPLSLAGFRLGMQPQGGVGPGTGWPDGDDLAAPRESQRDKQNEQDDATRPRQTQRERWSGGGRMRREPVHRRSSHRIDREGLCRFWLYNWKRRWLHLGLQRWSWRKWLGLRQLGRLCRSHRRPLAVTSRTSDEAPGRHQLIGNLIVCRAGRADDVHACRWWPRNSFEAMAARPTEWQ